MAPSVQDSCDRIHKVYQARAPPPDLSFNPPASEDDIDELEEKLSVTLPEDIKESLRIHNGMENFVTGELLSTSRVYDEWKVWSDLLEQGSFEDNTTEDDNDDTVEHCWWSTKWVPIVADGGGNGECLDLDPGEDGQMGQVIFMDHEDGQRPVRGNSFAEWLDDVAMRMEASELNFIIDNEDD